MFPIRDNVPRVHTPIAVFTIILLNFAVFGLELSLPMPDLVQAFYIFGVVPARFTDPAWAEAIGFPQGSLVPLFSYMYLHSGWLHIVLNMWSMWIFADNIEDVMGPVRFAVFYTLCGLAALTFHMAFNQGSHVPILGASGAIAGVMGAYFYLYPHARVLTLIPIIIIPYFTELPAIVFLGIWFLIQIMSGVFGGLAGGTGGGIAWWAHAGGFIAGIVLLPLFRRKGHCYYCYNRSNKNYEMIRNVD